MYSIKEGGGKVRLGINGRIQSGDLRVRQWKRMPIEDMYVHYSGGGEGGQSARRHQWTDIVE